jgi:glutaredoxin 3
MATVEIYTTKVCPYCVRAKNLLNAKDVDFTEIDLTGDDAGREALLKKSNGMRTVPQIFINGKHIGGCDNLYELEDRGELDKLLAE